MEHTLIRWTERQGNVVRWGNIIGGFSGQSGEWVFETDEDAEKFRLYAGKNPAPSLAEDDLRSAGIPLPTCRTREH